MEQKKFMKYGLSTENLRAYVDMIEEEVTAVLNHDPAFSGFQHQTAQDKLQNHAGPGPGIWGSFPAYKTLSEMTVLTAARTLQGAEIRASLNKQFADLYHDLDGGFKPVNLMFPNLPLPSYRRRDAAQKAMSDFYVSIIEKRRAEGHMVSVCPQLLI
jgi:sterol 14-demethylase